MLGKILRRTTAPPCRSSSSPSSDTCVRRDIRGENRAKIHLASVHSFRRGAFSRLVVLSSKSPIPQLVTFLLRLTFFITISRIDFPLIYFSLADSRAQTRPAVFSSRITNHRNGPRGHHDFESFLNRGGPSKVPKINFFPPGRQLSGIFPSST